MPALIVGSALLLAGGIALLVFRRPYGRAGGRAMAKTLAVYGDSEARWRRHYEDKARFGGWLLIMLGVIGLIVGVVA